MITSTFGKTMETLRNRIHVRLVNNVGNCKKYVRKPRFVSQKIFNKNLVAIHEIKPVLTLGKPIYVGFSTVADWDSVGRVITQTRGRAFQILFQAFDFLLNPQKLSRVF